jgi:hypothetical protein
MPALIGGFGNLIMFYLLINSNSRTNTYLGGRHKYRILMPLELLTIEIILRIVTK